MGVAPPSDDALLCPLCGYDLRAAPDERCSECGQIIPRDELTTSGIPFTRPRKRTVVVAYLLTVWRISIGSRKLRYEIARPQCVADARWFRRITGAIVSIFLLIAFYMLVQEQHGTDFLAVRPAAFHSRPPAFALWQQDLVLPWCAGITLGFVPPVLLIILAFTIVSAPGMLGRAKIVSPSQRERLGALRAYACAPIPVLMLITALILMVVAIADGLAWDLGFLRKYLIATELALVGAFLMTCFRFLQWIGRSHHGDALATMFSVARLLMLWLLEIILMLGLLPWCVGFLWILIDSFR